MAEEFTCPGCGALLEQVRMEHGVFWLCRVCGGRALNVELLRRTFSRESVNPFWSRVISGQGKTGRPCPCCERAMIEVALAEQPEAPAVEVCALCHFVWFDAGELEGMQPLPGPGQKAKSSGAEREARARARVAGMAVERSGRSSTRGGFNSSAFSARGFRRRLATPVILSEAPAESKDPVAPP